MMHEVCMKDPSKVSVSARRLLYKFFLEAKKLITICYGQKFTDTSKTILKYHWCNKNKIFLNLWTTLIPSKILDLVLIKDLSF